MTVKKANGKKRPIKTSYRVDIDQARLFWSRDGKEYIHDLLPIDDTVVVDLALQALYQKVKNAKDPYERADWIKAGSPKKINAPIVVRAIAEASNRPLGEVMATWKKLTKQEKEKLKADPLVIMNIKQLETPTDPRATDAFLDTFG